MKKRRKKPLGESTLNNYSFEHSKKNSANDQHPHHSPPKSSQEKLQFYQAISKIHQKEKIETPEKRSTFKESVMKRLRPKKI